MKLRFVKLLAVMTIVLLNATPLSAGKQKDEGRIEAKVWFKDGRVYEGEVPKHWLTYRQTFINPGHNFHIVSPDNPDKTIKCEAADVDSLLITGSTHEQFKAGDFYLPAAGISFKKGKYKLIRRISSGRNVDFCKMPYIGNCTVAGMNIDQRIEVWYVRFKESGKLTSFFFYPLQNGCKKAEFAPDNLASAVKDTNPGLAEAVLQRFSSKDKQTRKDLAAQVMENPQLFVDFVDDYINAHQPK